MNSHAYPEGFSTWPLDRKNAYFAEEYAAYARRKKVEKTPLSVLDYDPPSHAETESAPKRIFTPTLFTPRSNLSDFPLRQFLYTRHYIRDFLSATVAPSGVGKSSLSIAECVAMASGQNLLGIQPAKRLRVWYWNGEDPQEEIERRAHAACLHFGIKAGDLQGRLFLDSGRDTEIIIAEQTSSGTKIARPVEDALVEALCYGKFDVLVLDPVVATHRVSENDNMAIDAVAKTIGRIAGKARCAAEGVHHVRKTGGNEVTAEDSRGASALVAAARSVRVLNRMSEKDAELAGVADDRRSYFRSEVDKANLAPPSNATWFRLVNVALGNGSNQGVDDQDYVGVAIPWRWPDAFASVSISDLRAVQDRVAQGRWRENVQAKDWVGKPVAEVLGLNISNKAHRARINTVLQAWIKSGALVVVEGEDANREKRSFIEVGMGAND